MTQNPIIVEQTVNASVETVWEAITQPDLMRQWFFENITDFKPKLGFETQFVVALPERHFTHQWRILKVVPQQCITYHWSYKEYPGIGYVTFDLIDNGETTTVRLTNEGLESFPKDVPEFSEENCRGGWNYFIKGRLKEFLENK